MEWSSFSQSGLEVVLHRAGPSCSSWIRYFGNSILFISGTAQVCVHAYAMYEELSVITNGPVSHCYFSFILGKTRIVRRASVMTQNFFGDFLATPHTPTLQVKTAIYDTSYPFFCVVYILYTIRRSRNVVEETSLNNQSFY